MATQPVVDPVKMPKVKADNNIIATVNAVSTTLAIFMGWMTIFAAIASFTKKGWSVGIPFSGLLLGANAGNLGTIFACGLLTVLFAVIALISARKITDINAMKGSWKCVRNVFVVIATLEVFKMVALAIYALCGLGKKSGVDQGYLWLNGFLSNTLAAVAAGAVVFISNAIAAGKTQVLNIARFIALGVASVALIISVISMFVNFYAKGYSKGSSYDSSDVEDALDSAKSWLDLLK